jgi:hypothetical protein
MRYLDSASIALRLSPFSGVRIGFRLSLRSKVLSPKTRRPVEIFGCKRSCPRKANRRRETVVRGLRECVFCNPR